MALDSFLKAFMAICLAIIVFNLGCAVWFKRTSVYQAKLTGEYLRLLGDVITELDDATKLARHQQRIGRALRRTNHLVAYDRALDALSIRDPEGVRGYVKACRPIFNYLALYYQRKNPIRCAFFSHFISNYIVRNEDYFDIIADAMIAQMSQPNLYCRFNALRVLYRYGNVEKLYQALVRLDQAGGLPHKDLLTEGLLTFSGPHAALARMIIDHIKQFSVPTQVALLNYIRLKSGDYQEEFLALLKDTANDKEVRNVAIRYLGRYVYEPAKDPLRHVLSKHDSNTWECAVAAAASLASYTGGAVVETLKEALYDTNWFIRYNAARSLASMELPYAALAPVLNGSDRYAREALRFQLDERALVKARG